MDSCEQEKKKRQLVSVGIGAHGIIAIGIGAHGIIAIGVSAHGLIAIAIIPMGVISIGVISMGVFSVGAVSMGIVTLSSMGMGLYQFPQKPKSHDMEMGHFNLQKFPLANTTPSFLPMAETLEKNDLVVVTKYATRPVFQTKEFQSGNTCTVAQLQTLPSPNTAISFLPSPGVAIFSLVLYLLGMKLWQRR